MFLIATSFSFCSIIKDDRAKSPSSATIKTNVFSIVKVFAASEFFKSFGKLFVYKIIHKRIARLCFCKPKFFNTIQSSVDIIAIEFYLQVCQIIFDQFLSALKVIAAQLAFQHRLYKNLLQHLKFYISFSLFPTG